MLPVLLVSAASVQAHPFEAELYGHQSKLSVGLDRVALEYTAEVPTRAVLEELRDFLEPGEKPDEADDARFVALQLSSLESGLVLEVDGARASWRRNPLEGDNGLGDYRSVVLKLRLEADLPPGDQHELRLYDNNFPDLPGAYQTEVVVRPEVTVVASSLHDIDDGELRKDRSGQWHVEPKYREVELTIARRAGAEAWLTDRILAWSGSPPPEWIPASERLEGVHADPLSALLQGELTPAVVLGGLLVSIVLGALHAFGPGHGRTLVAAYLLGDRKTIRHAIWLGIIVTLTHTVAVAGLGLCVLLVSETTDPDAFLPWMEVLSGVIILGVGARLLWARMGTRGSQTPGESGTHAHHDHHHEHAAHVHDHALAPEEEEAHAAEHARAIGTATDMRSIVALGMSGGLVPCPSALVLLLTAVSLHRVGFGLLLVLAFSFGLGTVLAAIGSLVILFSGRLGARPKSSVATRLLPMAGALAVTAIGLVITLRGVQTVLAAAR